MNKTKSSVVYVRMDNDLKNKAERILFHLGISPSCAVQMLYRKILATNGLPWELKLSDADLERLDKICDENGDFDNPFLEQLNMKESDKIDESVSSIKNKNKSTETTQPKQKPTRILPMNIIVKPKSK